MLEMCLGVLTQVNILLSFNAMVADCTGGCLGILMDFFFLTGPRDFKDFVRLLCQYLSIYDVTFFSSSQS